MGGVKVHNYRNRRSVFFSFICLLVLLFAASSAAVASVTDEEKKQQVYKLYDEYRQKFAQVPEISAEEVLQLRQNNADLLLIDTRDADEMAVSMLPDAVSAEEFLQHLDRYRESLLVAYCTIGYRSGVLATEMIDKGLVIHNLKGGILGWLHAGGKVLHGGKEVHKVHVYGRKWDLAPGRYETVQYSFFKQLF